MATTNVLHGGQAWVFVEGSLVAESTSHTLSITSETRDITNKDSGSWRKKLYGVKDFNGSLDAFYALDNATVDMSSFYSYMDNETTVTIMLARTYNGESPGSVDQSTDNYYYGECLITSIEVNSGNEGENMTYSVSFEGDGKLYEAQIT